MKRYSLIKKGEWFISVDKNQKKRDIWFCKNHLFQAPEVLMKWGVPKYILKEAEKQINDYDPTERWDVDNASWDCGESVYE